ncbi:MAG TPA: NADPH-dependent 7-cyano-7-deazaguanine reductase QueF, partial [Desulfuromonadales bacterium]|nr:NADPH-dependent 7-cyano-7-deazaguanine reductase QueF [Desulfuromonadales bacterium]
MDKYEASLPLGRESRYSSEYDSSLLCPVPRRATREEIEVFDELPFSGVDIWNAYELSWLTTKGKPVVAIGEFRFSCESTHLIESKSLKLYLNSFNQTRFESLEKVCEVMAEDLSKASGAEVGVHLLDSAEFVDQRLSRLPGECIDGLDISIDRYALSPALLEGAADAHAIVEETLCSHLFKSNCLVTSQPDWASVLIRYQGG